MDQEEADAIKRVLGGDRDAYRVLMDRHFRSIYRLAYRVIGDEADAEDAAQEAFVRAYNKLSTFRRDAGFGTWVSRIAMNTAINLVERRNRDMARHAVRIGDETCARDATVQAADGAAGPERRLFDAEAATLRQAAMATLTPMERTAFILRHMEDLPITEIAEALNVPANSVKQAVFRAVGKLRLALAPLAGGMR